MLGYKVPCARMEASCQERGEDKVVEGVERCEFDKYIVECELRKDVEQVDAGKRNLVNHHGSKRVEEDLESAEE